MKATPLRCARCHAELPTEPAVVGSLERCPVCGESVRVVVFPASQRPLDSGVPSQRVLAEGEAVCAFHAERRAAASCDTCGRLVCALCDLELEGRHYCPSCLEQGRRKGGIESIERRRTRYDLVVLALLVYPVLSCGALFPVTSLAALSVIGLGWRAPVSRVVRTRFRLGVFIPIALVELAAGIAFWAMAFKD